MKLGNEMADAELDEFYLFNWLAVIYLLLFIQEHDRTNIIDG